MNEQQINSPWHNPADDRPYQGFGNIEIHTTKEPGKDYLSIGIYAIPLNGNTIERNVKGFDRGWKIHTRQSIDKLVHDGKVAYPDVGNDGNVKVMSFWGSWFFAEWRDFSKGSLEYYKQENPDKIQHGTNGSAFVAKNAIKFINAFSDEAECTQASDAHFGVQSSENDVPWEEPAKAEPKQNDSIRATVATFIPALVKQALNGNNRVDSGKLAEIIAGNSIVSQYFTIDSDEFQAAITEIEKEPAF